MSLYSHKRYRDEALVHFDAVEEWTSDNPTTIDAGIPDAPLAMALSNARRDVHAICAKHDLDWVAVEDAGITYPASADYIQIEPPGSVLRRPPQAILLIEDVRQNTQVPIYRASRDERWRGDLRAWPYAATLTGGRLRLRPLPPALTLRFTYVPVLGHVTRQDLTSERMDDEIPVAAQFAVPIRAAIYLCITDQRPHAQLERMWADAQVRLADAARMRESFSPRFPRSTRPYVGLAS